MGGRHRAKETLPKRQKGEALKAVQDAYPGPSAKEIQKLKKLAEAEEKAEKDRKG